MKSPSAAAGRSATLGRLAAISFLKSAQPAAPTAGSAGGASGGIPDWIMQVLQRFGPAIMPMLAPMVGQAAGLPGLMFLNDLLQRGGRGVRTLFGNDATPAAAAASPVPAATPPAAPAATPPGPVAAPPGPVAGPVAAPPARMPSATAPPAPGGSRAQAYALATGTLPPEDRLRQWNNWENGAYDPAALDSGAPVSQAPAPSDLGGDYALPGALAAGVGYEGWKSLRLPPAARPGALRFAGRAASTGLAKATPVFYGLQAYNANRDLSSGAMDAYHDQTFRNYGHAQQFGSNMLDPAYGTGMVFNQAARSDIGKLEATDLRRATTDMQRKYSLPNSPALKGILGNRTPAWRQEGQAKPLQFLNTKTPYRDKPPWYEKFLPGT